MATVAYSTSTGGFVTPVRGDREYVRDVLIARGVAAGWPREVVERAVKKYRAV